MEILTFPVGILMLAWAVYELHNLGAITDLTRLRLWKILVYILNIILIAICLDLIVEALQTGDRGRVGLLGLIGLALTVASYQLLRKLELYGLSSDS